jgi:predicted transcriptional regulator
MSDEDKLLPDRTISIRLPSQLATELRKAATREANPDSVVARRLIAAGLARERQATQTPEGEAA